MNIEQRLKELGIILPESSPPAGAYAKAVILDGFAHLSGQGPVSYTHLRAHET